MKTTTKNAAKQAKSSKAPFPSTYYDNQTAQVFQVESRGAAWVRLKLGEDSYWFTNLELARHFSPALRSKLH